MIFPLNPVSSNSNSFPTISQITRNMIKISYLALPVVASSMLATCSAGLVSYTACLATCPAMAAMAPPPLFAYTFETCMASCSWLLSPTSP